MLSTGLWVWYFNITITILDIIHRPVFYLKQLNFVGLSVLHRKHITSQLRARQVNDIYRFVSMVYQYNYHNSGHYPSSCLLFKTQLNSVGLSVLHRKHITSQLRSRQVNVIYRFVSMVYQYKYHNSGRYPSSCLLFKTQLNSVGLSVLHRKHITSQLRARQVNDIYRFVSMICQYNYHNSGHYPSSCLFFKTQLNSVGLSVLHRKHITSPLQAQQVNAIYRFVKMVY
jgi:hypothetical protein